METSSTRPPMPEPTPASRSLSFERMFNVRTLGGLPAADGKVIRPGHLLRSDDPHVATPDDRLALTSLSVHTVIDLRIADEVDQRGASTWTELGTRRSSTPWWTHIPPRSEMHRYLSPESAAGLYAEMHLASLDLQAEAWTALAEASDRHTVVHCASGRDRTGILVAILLAGLGVPTDHIAADYAYSGVGMERMLDHLESTLTEDEIWALNLDRKGAVYSPPETIRRFLDWLVEHHGGIDGYFADVDSTAALHTLRGNLLVAHPGRSGVSS